MGTMVLERVSREVDLWRFTPEYYKNEQGKRVQRHIIQEGARYHVVGWRSDVGAVCSEKDCEINYQGRK